MLDTVPTSDEFRPVVLRILSDGEMRSRRHIYTAAADYVNLSPEAREQRIPSGKLRLNNRVGWACSGLYHAGLLRRPKRGWYEITDNGRVVDQRNLDTYSEKDLFEWSQWAEYQAEIAARKATRKTAPSEYPQVAQSDDKTDPIEVIATRVEEYNAGVETELRKRLQESSAEFFEQAVIDLLWAMGYGGTHGDKQRVGRTSDGGIDGVINQDALGLQKVCIQAKRYKDGNNIGSAAIRDFYGALDQVGAAHGVFITSSAFTPEAISTASRYNGRIVLLDGVRLTSLMLEREVAVQKVQDFALYEVDEDFFDEGKV